MTECIDREAAMSVPVLPKEYRKYQTDNVDAVYENGWNDALNNLQNVPAADVVPKAVFEQMRWERDTAVAQLREGYSVELGERRRQ